MVSARLLRHHDPEQNLLTSHSNKAKYKDIVCKKNQPEHCAHLFEQHLHVVATATAGTEQDNES